MDIDGPFLLYGAGREARSSLDFLQSRFPSAQFLATIDKGNADLPGAQSVPIEEAREMARTGQIGTLVKSPGIPPHTELLQTARAASIPITSNLNLWAGFFKRPQTLIAVTGTKGKSTTASLLFAMLKGAYRNVGLGGNVGVAPLEAKDQFEILVLELSSYQIADMDWGADIVAVTSLFPEHTDWHGSAERYFADKLSILEKSPDAKLVFGPSAAIHPLIVKRQIAPARLLPALEDEFDLQLEQAASQGKLLGLHNLDNARLAARIALSLNVDPSAILAAVRQFAPLRHRLEPFSIGQKMFVDDSISTTPEATKAALNAYFGQRIALVAGGYDRGQDYTDLVPVMRQSGVELVFCLPDTGERLARSIERDAPHISVVQSPDLEAAMAAAQLRENHFDVLILSPGAPSYNQFANFEERGDRFIALARQHFAERNLRPKT